MTDNAPAASVIHRHAIRAILLTPQREVLLMRIHAPGSSEWFWITPGGGLEGDESPQAGLRRELAEEVGIDDIELGPLVWRRQHTFNWGERRLCQREDYYIVHIDRFEPRMSDLVEVQVLDRFEWWSVDALAVTDEDLTPTSLHDIVARYLRDGAPRDPLELEVLVD
jgi:8-oxo-dGTP pyrophosphatase MutT (NUDIX family)